MAVATKASCIYLIDIIRVILGFN